MTRGNPRGDSPVKALKLDSNFFHPLFAALDDISVNPILTTLHLHNDA